jgi:hypothetical protein
MNQLGIKPATFQLVAQYLNQLHHHVPPYLLSRSKKLLLHKHVEL